MCLIGDPDRRRGDLPADEVKWWVPYAVEFVGTLLFQVFGGSTAATMDAVFNGVVLTVIVFITAKASGGVVNPSVALMLFIVGEISWFKAAAPSSKRSSWQCPSSAPAPPQAARARSYSGRLSRAPPSSVACRPAVLVCSS